MINQIDPVWAHVTEGIALLNPFEGAGRDLQWLLEIRRTIQRIANPLADVLPNAQMVRIITLVHIHRHDSVFFSGEFDDLVSLGGVETHWFLGHDRRVCAKTRGSSLC